MNSLTRFDTTALQKALLGFDSIFNDFERKFANQISSSYPPFNFIKKDENKYELEIAVTGFSPDEVTVEIDQNQLIIRGEKVKDDSILACQRNSRNRKKTYFDIFYISFFTADEKK